MSSAIRIKAIIVVKAKMVTCELDPEVSGEILGWKLPTWQALLFHRVLPSCGGLIVYLTLMCFDTALIYQHYQSGHNGLAAFSIVLMVLPALLSLVFTLASLPPGWQTEADGWAVNVKRSELKWIVIQFLYCIFFPVAAIGRYCHQIFWWVEALCAVRDCDKERTADAVQRAKEPSPLELYLFLQAFIHAAPHAVVNILELMARFNDPLFDKVSVQAVSIVASMMRMASTATLYRRFEREKLCGRKYPWNNKLDPDENIKNDEKFERNKEEPLYEAILKKTSINSQQSSQIREDVNSDTMQYSLSKSEGEKPNTNSDLIKFSPEEGKRMPWDDEYYSDSGTSSDFLPNDTIDRHKTSSQGSAGNSDEEYMRPISIIHRVAPRRRETNYTVERVEIIPPPIMLAPRPMSFSVWAEKIVENAESIPSWLSAPQRHKYVEEYMIPEEPEIPQRTPRWYLRGLEPQDLTAGLVQYLGWYAFFVSRLLSIAAFINCMPVVSTIVLGSHYQIMLLLLIVPQASSVRRAFYIFLAFIYLFCLMEFKIRFRHVRVWHVFWIIVCTVEAIVFTSLWSLLGNEVGDWWRVYIVKVVFCSLLLSYMCFLVYFVLLKPREIVVYMNGSKNNNKSTS